MSDPHQLNGALEEAQTHFSAFLLLGLHDLADYLQRDRSLLSHMSLPATLILVSMFTRWRFGTLAHRHTHQSWVDEWHVERRRTRMGDL